MYSDYKLRDCIDAHEDDVKSICVLPQGCGLLSASRDLSVRLWKENNMGFQKHQHYLFHKSYISVVYFMKACPGYPDGIIFSAGYDKVIKGFLPDSTNFLFSLTGHTNTVNTISSFPNGDLISGSMDGTIILWDLSNSTPKQIFKGHKYGIWSVLVLSNMSNEYFLSASADKEIYLWNINKTDPNKKFIGHTDCVRALLECSNINQFLSCSNDATIRLWCLKTGSTISVFKGHTSFIYALVKINNDRFASCGEDKEIFVWSLNKTTCPLQRIAVNAQSIWCAGLLDNGDLVMGCSDGMIRMYSENTGLQNGIDVNRKINKDILEQSFIKELPSMGIESLSLPGDHDNQLIRIHDEDCEILYEWSSERQLWIKKKVLGSIGAAQKTHDYVFSIDIKDSEPPLKLPYNNGQDPWLVAKQFIDDNDLSPMFLDQVANFIITNSDQQHPKCLVPVNDFSDPFTGSSRYIPSAGLDTTHNQRQFPYLSYFRYDQINAFGLSKKVLEIASTIKGVPENVRSCMESINSLSVDQSDILCTWVLDEQAKWPDDQLYPLIDVLRMLVREPKCSSLCFSNNDFFVKLLLRTTGSKVSCSNKGNVLTTLKLAVNAFLQLPGENYMNSIHKQIVESLHQVTHANIDKHILVAISSCLLNMSVCVNLHHDESKRNEILELCFTFIKIFESANCMEAIHRTLVTIGTLVCNVNSFTFRETLPINVFEKISNFVKMYNDEKKWSRDINICSQQLELLVSSLDFLHF